MMNRLKALMCGAVLACAGAAGGAGSASAQELTMAVWGGGGANTWREAFIKQFNPGNGSTIKMVEVPNPAGALRSPAAAGQYNLALVTYFEAIALSNAGLIESFDDRQLPGIADVDPKYLTKDKAGRHVGLPVYFTYYGIAYNTDLAKGEDFSSWQGLADPKWKGKICSRPGTHVYNTSLVATMIAHKGEAATETWLKGVKANLARKPAGGDRDQVRQRQDPVPERSHGR